MENGTRVRIRYTSYVRVGEMGTIIAPYPNDKNWYWVDFDSDRFVMVMRENELIPVTN